VTGDASMYLPQRILFALFTALHIALLAPAAQASDSKYIGSQSCSSTSCHGRSEPREFAAGLAGASLREFQLYVRHDPHAQAARTLASSEFHAILGRLSEQGTGLTRAAVYQQCASCHDPEGMAFAKVDNADLAPPEVGHSAAGRGISCEACHGGAKGWLTTHYQRDLSRSSLVNAGMRDTKELAVRAALCASCHVGGAGQNVNHDLLAAGHPPLRFELAAYHRKLTSHDQEGKQSHWNDARERIATSEFEVQLWKTGQSASAKAALSLLADRAKFAAQSENGVLPAPWPEFAEYECFDCHQKLRLSNARKPKLRGDFPEWREWNLAVQQTSDEARTLDSLRQEMQKGFAGQPDVVEKLSNRTSSSFIVASDTHTSAGKLLQILQQPEKELQSWDLLCRKYLALRAVQKCSGDEFQKLELAGRAKAIERGDFNKLRSEIDRDLGAIGRELSFADDKSEWPSVLSEPNGTESVESLLIAAAGKLRTLQTYIEPRQ
jgi:hypothetical protein